MSIPYGQNQGMWLGPDPAHQQQQQVAPAAPPMPAVPPPTSSVQGPRLPPLLAQQHSGHAGHGTAWEPSMPVVGGGYPAAAPQQQQYDQSALVAQQQEVIARLMQQNQQLMGHPQPTTSGGWPTGVPAPVPASPMHSTQMHPQQQVAYQHQHAQMPQHQVPQQQMPQAQPQPQQQQTVGRPQATAAQMLQEAWSILHAHQTAPAMQGVSGAALGRAVNTNIGGLAMGGPAAMHGEIYAAPQLTEQHQRLLVETQAPAIGQREAGVGGAPRLWFGETVGGQAPGLPTFGEGNDVRPFLYNPVQVPYGVNEVYVQPQ